MAEVHDDYNLPVDGQYYLLLYERPGEKRERGLAAFSKGKKFVPLHKGEILTEVRKKDQPKDETLIRLTPVDRPLVTLECPTTEVQRIDHEEASLLLPLCSLSERVRVFQEGNRLEFGKRINIDSDVWVNVPVDGNRREFQGVIRYKGQLPGISGTIFGVELLGQESKGSNDGSFKGKQYFCCKKDSGVFVSLERLSPHSSKNTPKSDGDIKIKTIENIINGDSEENQDDKESKESLGTSMLTNPSIMNAIEKDIGHKIGDVVMVYIEEEPRRGMIKYIGCMPGDKVILAGIHLDHKYGQGDGVYNGRQLFSCPYGHAYFTPIMNVISEEMFGEMYDQPDGQQELEEEMIMPSTQQSSSDNIVQMESSFTKRSKEDIIREQKEILEIAREGAFLRRQTESETSSSSEVETPLLEAQERTSWSGFTPESNKEVPDLELGEKNVATEETALNTDPVAEMGSLLTCSICLEMLTDSRILGCHHSFCKCCLERYVKRQREEASAKPAQEESERRVEGFECPNCRFPFFLKEGQGVEVISPNHLVNSMVEVVQRIEPKKSLSNIVKAKRRKRSGMLIVRYMRRKD